MADIVTNLATDPLVDGNGNDERCDANMHRLVKYVRSLKAQDVPQQVGGQALPEVSVCICLLYTTH